jgi:hypothetical protein
MPKARHLAGFCMGFASIFLRLAFAKTHRFGYGQVKGIKS